MAYDNPQMCPMFTCAETTVTTVLTTIGGDGILVRDDVMSVEVYNTGSTNATNAFVLQFCDHPDGEWFTYLSGTQWADGSIQDLRRCTNNATNPLPTALTAGARSHFAVYVSGAWLVRFLASVASSTTTVIIRGSFRRQSLAW